MYELLEQVRALSAFSVLLHCRRVILLLSALQHVLVCSRLFLSSIVLFSQNQTDLSKKAFRRQWGIREEGLIPILSLL